MNAYEDRLEATCRMPDADRRRLVAAVATLGDEQRQRTQIAAAHGYTGYTRKDPPRGYPKEDSETLSDKTLRDDRWTWSYLRALTDRDFAPVAELRLPRAGWFTFLTSILRPFKRARREGGDTYAGIVIDKPVLHLLGITPETVLDLTTNGISLILTPRPSLQPNTRRSVALQAHTLNSKTGAFPRLA